MSRADLLEPVLAEGDIDLLLVTDIVNVRWLTGFTGTNGLAVIGGGRRIFITDFRYTEQAAEQVPDFDRPAAEREILDGLPAALGEAATARLGFDDAHLSVKAHERLRELLSEAELVVASGIVEDARAVKDAGELESIRAAAALADDALSATLEDGLIGRSERAIARSLEDHMRRLGAREPSFPSIVAAAGHSALPHAEPRETEVPPDTLITIDWGAWLDGYCSDCTRTFATGEVADEMRDVYELVERAQAESLAAVAPGPLGSEVDAVAREIIDAAGHGEHFGHGLGHGVGMEVHEEPRLSKSGKAPLVAGNVVTVEPGVYLPGRFGVRIEDLVAVTPDGHEVFSGLPKGLTVVS